MGKFPALMITLASSLLFFLQTLEVVKGAKCYGNLASNSSYAQNRGDLFSTLANKVLTNGGVYNASRGQYPNRVYALGLCARGFKPKACFNCLERLTLETQRDCPNIMDSFVWGSDDEDRVSCLVRSSNHTFGNLELSPPVTGISPDHIEPSINMTLFMQQWEYTVNNTLEAATKANTPSVHKYYSAVKAEFTAFPNVYMLTQCTPDITSEDCKQCLEACLKYFRVQFRGRTGGMVSLPSCFFRWDLFSFHGVFDNVTRVPALPRLQPQEKGSSIPDKKGRSMHWGIITIIVVFTFFNLLGKLLNGKEIAVKRLARGSEGGIEFRNEVSLLTRLQHKNLVKLLGFCNEGDEEILVYEFVSHSSLDRFIFEEEKRSLLTWEVRFKIINGIARGLVYLHEDSQLKIIHRDLKASNILLDAEMNPKVADFGTARLFHTDETQAETKRIAGTRGYMAPEYLNHGQISAKSDVYSFGVVLLEMISGQRNNSFEGEGIAAFAWKRWAEGRPEVIIDPLLVKNSSVEIIKFIQTGLLCVQENATNRPTMSSVMLWLGSETITIPLPKAPALAESHSQSEDGTMSMSNVFTELSSR
ncbi:hypothetical protein Bca52824_002589 [Brassica carinata]|uniref:Cysteine-rich receptor-like protein kinase 39 n=1 Tax=Brassica carinata TaxID=52824 RepID=A0A8X7WIE0_BRACI|nr:hypothetical protein Bca52824_002589 [Brassica carinata]